MPVASSHPLTVDEPSNETYVTIDRYPTKCTVGTIHHPDLWRGMGTWYERTVRNASVRELRPQSPSKKASPSLETAESHAQGGELIYGGVQDRSWKAPLRTLMTFETAITRRSSTSRHPWE